MLDRQPPPPSVGQAARIAGGDPGRHLPAARALEEARAFRPHRARTVRGYTAQRLKHPGGCLRPHGEAGKPRTGIGVRLVRTSRSPKCDSHRTFRLVWPRPRGAPRSTPSGCRRLEHAASREASARIGLSSDAGPRWRGAGRTRRTLRQSIPASTPPLGRSNAPVTTAQRRALARYVALLAQWNRAYNLTAVRDPFAMIDRHVLDSLTALDFLVGARLLDVGTGAGLPGLVLAVVRPDVRCTLLDPVRKKTRFCAMPR